MGKVGGGGGVEMESGMPDISLQLNLLSSLKKFTQNPKQALFTFTFARFLLKYYFPRLTSLPRHPVWNR